ncbi:unnamed protein product, partial [Ceratitis capitata]
MKEAHAYSPTKRRQVQATQTDRREGSRTGEPAVAVDSATALATDIDGVVDEASLAGRSKETTTQQSQKKNIKAGKKVVISAKAANKKKKSPKKPQHIALNWSS